MRELHARRPHKWAVQGTGVKRTLEWSDPEAPVKGARPKELKSYLGGMKGWILLAAGLVMGMGVNAQPAVAYYQSPVKDVDRSWNTCACTWAGMLENSSGVSADLREADLVEAVYAGEEGTLMDATGYLSGRGMGQEMVAGGQRAQLQKGSWLNWKAERAKNAEGLKGHLEAGVKGIGVRYWMPLKAWEGSKKGEIVLSKAARREDGSKGWGWRSALVVGYDETGFWLKLCRGVEWGVGGYVHIGFEEHGIMAEEVVMGLVVEGKQGEGGRRSEKWVPSVKSLPEKLDDKKYISLSLCGSDTLGMPSVVTEVRYVLCEGEGCNKVVLEKKTWVNGLNAGGGYAVLMPVEEGVEKVYGLRVVLKGEGHEEVFQYEGIRWGNGEYFAR